MRYSLKEKREFARQMRDEPTEAEALLWSRLSGRKIGYYIRRQVTVCGYIVDFWCASAKLAIEVDGGIHQREDVVAWDEEKERALDRYNIGLLRFSNEDVFQSVKLVTAKIRQECDLRKQNQTPLKGFGFDFRAVNKQAAVVEKPNLSDFKEQDRRNRQAEHILASPAYEPRPVASVSDLSELLVQFRTLARERTMPADTQTAAERAFDQRYRLGVFLKRKTA